MVAALTTRVVLVVVVVVNVVIRRPPGVSDSPKAESPARHAIRQGRRG